MSHDQLRTRMQCAHAHGKARGYEAVEHCEIGEDETLREAALRSERNARQFHGHVPQWIRDNRDFFQSYEDGVTSAIVEAT